jgi:hypothetical protein
MIVFEETYTMVLNLSAQEPTLPEITNTCKINVLVVTDLFKSTLTAITFSSFFANKKK